MSGQHSGRREHAATTPAGAPNQSAQEPVGSERARHRSLYCEIPSMRCLDGCAACCGPAPVSPWEAERLGIPGAVVTPAHPGTSRCAFHIDGGCSVYERRPFVCRLYGTTAVAPCERGRAPTTLIPSGRAVRMVERFEAGCPPSWQDDRQTAAREVVTAAGDTDALASLDGHRAALDRARAAIGALQGSRTDRATAAGDAASGTLSPDTGTTAGTSAGHGPAWSREWVRPGPRHAGDDGTRAHGRRRARRACRRGSGRWLDHRGADDGRRGSAWVGSVDAAGDDLARDARDRARACPGHPHAADHR